MNDSNWGCALVAMDRSWRRLVNLGKAIDDEHYLNRPQLC